MEPSTICTLVGALGAVSLLVGFYEQWSKRSPSPSADPKIDPAESDCPPMMVPMSFSGPCCAACSTQVQRKASKPVRLQGPGAVSGQQVKKAATAFIRDLRRYARLVGISEFTSLMLERSAGKIGVRALENNHLAADRFLNVLIRTAIRPIESVLFRRGHSSPAEVLAARRLAKRALTFVSLASRYDLSTDFQFDETLTIEAAPKDPAELREHAIHFQVQEVEFKTPKGHWHRLAGIPVRMITARNGRKYCVFSISRASTPEGLEIYQTAVATPAHLRPNIG